MAINTIPNDPLLREALRRRHDGQPQPRLSAGFADRVMARIDGDRKVKPLARRRTPWLYIAAACATLLVVATLFLSRSKDSQPAIVQAETIRETTDTAAPADTVVQQPVVQPETRLMAKAPVRHRQRKATSAPVEQEKPVIDEAQAYTEMAINETDLAMSKAEEAIALFCKNLDRGLSYIENLNIETT